MSGITTIIGNRGEDIATEYHSIRKYGANLAYLNEHVGTRGAFDVVDKHGKIEAGTHYGKGDDEIISYLYTKNRPGTAYGVKYEGESWTCLNTDLGDGYGLVVMTPDSEMYQYRDRLAYETVLADILLFTVIYILVSLLVQMIVVDNLKRVNESLAKITDGDFNEQVSVYESSEFASLSNDINEMVDALKGYIDAAEKRIEQELLLARTIQASSLPDNFEFAHGGFEIYATMDPAKKVGGDFYDFFFAGPEKLAVVIADVSDKGIPAALFMMQSKTAIRSLAETGSGITEIFEKVNNELCDGNEAEMFVTVWMAFVNLVTGEVECVNAGHEYPAIMIEDGQYKLLKDKHGLPLGCMEGMTYESYKIKLEIGDCIYVYTDGIAEAINTNEEQFGTDRMLDVLNKNKDTTMVNMLGAVKTAVDEFAGEAEQFDDQTMVGFRYTGLPERTNTEA
jgi:serine phosphatase RsbU (regulator of sigma subunit)